MVSCSFNRLYPFLLSLSACVSVFKLDFCSARRDLCFVVVVVVAAAVFLQEVCTFPYSPLLSTSSSSSVNGIACGHLSHGDPEQFDAQTSLHNADMFGQDWPMSGRNVWTTSWTMAICVVTVVVEVHGYT